MTVDVEGYRARLDPLPIEREWFKRLCIIVDQYGPDDFDIEGDSYASSFINSRVGRDRLRTALENYIDEEPTHDCRSRKLR